MAHVFISYSKQNRIYAHKLADDLLKRGFDVWIDDRIDSGEDWERAIYKAVDECAAFIVIMTPQSSASKWVQRERLYAEQQNKPAFPLLLKGEPFPFYVASQYEDVRHRRLPSDEFYKQLVRFAPPDKVAGNDVTSVPQQQVQLSRRRKLLWGGLAAVIVAVAALLAPSMLNRDTSSTPTPPELAQTAANTLETSIIPGGNTAQIAFVSDRDGKTEIYAMDADGTNLHPLTNNASFEANPAWSPDGNQLAFESTLSGNWDIVVMNADGTNIRELTFPPGYSEEPTWSPDGQQIAFQSDRDGSRNIYVMNVDGTNVRRLTDDAPANDIAAAWSPDGTQIAFSLVWDGNGEIYVMNVDGSSQQRLTQNLVDDNLPAWSPDGQSIAFTSNRDGNYEIYCMNSDGTNVRRLTDNPADDTSPAWSPDGRQIAFASSRDSNFAIFAMNPDGSNVRRLTNGSANDQYPAWRP